MRNAEALKTAAAIIFGIVFTAMTFLGHLSPMALRVSIEDWRKQVFDPIGINTHSWMMFKSQGDGVPYARLVFLSDGGAEIGKEQLLESGVDHLRFTSRDKLNESVFYLRQGDYLTGFVRSWCERAPEGTTTIRYEAGVLHFTDLDGRSLKDIPVTYDFQKEITCER